jgi:hypothetical protein
MEQRREGDERKEERKADVLPDFKTMSISCELPSPDLLWAACV